VKGSGGVFEVTLDNQVIFSKKATGRFPLPGEVVAALEQKVGT
jgi:selT/selW/selH-like putative selenoprotein